MIIPKEHDQSIFNSTGEGCHDTVNFKTSCNKLKSLAIRLHLSNRNLCSAWAVIRVQFYKALLRV